MLVSGNKVAELHPGSYFGEAALLHDAPRNATVRAMNNVTCGYLDRDTFKNLVGSKVGAIIEKNRQNSPAKKE